MSAKRYLIVNADDFGLSRGVNRGIIKAHEKGIVTSASLMIRWPAAAEAADYFRKHADLSLGLHIDLGEWIFRDEVWAPLYEVVSTEDSTAIKVEVYRQLDSFHDLVGQKPTHLDSHQHVHVRKPVRSVLIEMACRLGIPLRHCSPGIRYCGDFYGQTECGSLFRDAISVERLIEILQSLPPGVTELACHPGQDDELETMYCRERAWEVKTLCAPRVGTALEEMNIELCSFRDVPMPSGKVTR
ncbi:MAG: ChbG/HpnK family deacetylase [Candidatus Thiodiazotropha sp. (ex Rostrolucina anterorostrata)]|nr:ChbG/HpnK family deacetylase [Candidatus Thiodiazotropha sp. (ex Rostrolucina anterorostrata)]